MAVPVILWWSPRPNFAFNVPVYRLTHWGRVTHICVGKLTIIGSDNGLSPGRRQAIIWTNAGKLLFGPPGTNFNEILIEIHIFSFKKIDLKMSSSKWRPFCLGLNVLMLKQVPYDKSESLWDLWDHTNHIHLSQFYIFQNSNLRPPKWLNHYTIEKKWVIWNALLKTIVFYFWMFVYTAEICFCFANRDLQTLPERFEILTIDF